MKNKKTKTTKNLKLYSIGNDGNFNYYIFDKRQNVMESLSKIFFSILKLGWDLYEEYEDENGKWIHKKRYIKNYKDFHERINKIGFENRIDIFYGDKKMFITLHCSNNLRLKFNEELFKLFDMPKPKKNLKFLNESK